MLTTLLAPYSLPGGGRPHRVNGIRVVQPGQTVTLADIAGPGCIHHLYMTMPPRRLRELVLRIWWDGETSPSIESPLSDFFGVGHEEVTADLSSPCFFVAPRYGYNCYLPMPFASRAYITVTNEAPEPNPAVYVMVGYQTFDAPMECPWRLHAAWRRVFPAYRRGAPLTLLEAQGEGTLAGVIYHIGKRDSDDRWSHGGGDQLFIDGDTARPSYVAGVGGEDFAHHAWGLYPGRGPYSGAHRVHPVPEVKRGEGPTPFEPHGWEQHDGGRYSMYRFFIPDPMPFRHSLRLTFGTCANEISATTYWYQNEPHRVFCRLPAPAQRRYGSRVTEEETWQPLPLAGDLPVAVLGLFGKGASAPWSPVDGLDLAGRYPSDLQKPFADLTGPPWEARWRRSGARAGFLDLMAIYRPKIHLRPRGWWNYRNLPYPARSYQLLRVRAKSARQVILRAGFEDQLQVWLNGAPVATHERPEPLSWETVDVPLKLKRGVNDVIVANTQERLARWSAWAIYLKLITPDGAPAEGLEYDPFTKLDATPERWFEPPLIEPGGLPDYRDPAYLV